MERQGAQRRGSDGRRLFSAEFKREQIGRVVRKELTFAELSRELGIDQSVVRRWQHLAEGGSRTAVAANEAVVPASELRAAQQRIRAELPEARHRPCERPAGNTNAHATLDDPRMSDNPRHAGHH